jgi:hypothetical protein
MEFFEANNTLYAVLQQPFIISDETADLNAISEYLEFNGFMHLKTPGLLQ